MVKRGKGTPTYTATHYVEVVGTTEAHLVMNALLLNSVFFVVEPEPDGVWRYYVKEEYFDRLVSIVEAVRLDI